MSLELDRQPRRSAEPKSFTPADSSSWYPEIKKDNRWLGALVRRVVIGVAVVAALGVGWRAWQGGRLPRPLAALLEGVSKMDDGQAVNDVAGVDCFTGSDGEYLAYTDATGTENIVESPAQVPARYKGVARCLFLKR